MPPPFRKMTLDEFQRVAVKFRWEPNKSEVHVHHTFIPNHGQFRGLASIESMHRFHTTEAGFSDIAQHITIDPAGAIWTGRPWNVSPASASGHNSRKVFMFETLGNFDTGRDPLAGEQRDSVIAVIGTILAQFGLDGSAIRFHNEMSGKTCPGSSVGKPKVVADALAYVAANRDRLRALAAQESAGELESAVLGDLESPDPLSVDEAEDAEHPSSGDAAYEAFFATENP